MEIIIEKTLIESWGNAFHILLNDYEKLYEINYFLGTYKLKLNLETVVHSITGPITLGNNN